MAQSSLLMPEKRLRFTEKFFPGYWVQLNTLIRRNEHADEVIDGILIHPMLEVLEVYTTPGDPHNAHATAILQLYVAKNLGSPIGQFPTAEDLEHDPIRGIRDFAIATASGTDGGLNPATGRNWIASSRWARVIHTRNVVFRSACKHIWETIVATFSSAEAVTVIAGLPYGSGMKLLFQVKHMQQRQTTMALFTLFSQLISMQLRSGEKVAGLYGRLLEIRQRLENWDPPIILPDQLLIVCMLRMLPRQFHATRTIIMSRDVINLEQSKDMLLDVENQDAERVNAAVGSKPTVKPTSTATALVTNGPPRRVKKKKKKKRRPNPKDDPTKTAKYHSEGPCSYHGSRCKHASSECWELHPELKATAAVAEVEGEAYAATTAIATREQVPTPFGFLNEDWGYGLVTLGEEVNTANDELTIVLTLRRGVRSVGKHKGCLTEPVEPKFPHSSIRPDTEGRLTPIQPKGRVLTVVEQTVKPVKVERPTCYPGDVQAGANTSNDVDPDIGLQLQCASLIKWISKTAAVPYARINAAIRDADQSNDHRTLRRAIEYGQKEHSWLWMCQQCGHLTNKQSCRVHAALVASFVNAVAHVQGKPRLTIGLIVCSDVHVVTSVITTAALNAWEIDDPTDFVTKIKLDVCVTPRGFTREILMRGVTFNIIDSAVPYAMIAGLAADLLECRMTEQIDTYAYSAEPKRKGYALMMKGNDQEPESEERISDLEERMRDAEELLMAITPACHNSASLKRRATKGLQTLMREERTATTPSRVTAGSARATATTNKAKHTAANSQRSKAKRRYKGHGWSRKPKGHRSKSKVNSKSVATAETVIDVTGNNNPAAPRRSKQKLLATQKDAKYYRGYANYHGKAKHTSGKRKSKSTARPKHKPSAIKYDPSYGMTSVKLKYNTGSGRHATMTCRSRCRSGALSSAATPKARLPMIIQVPVPDHFTLMVRIAESRLENRAALLIPGTDLSLQVVEVVRETEAYVTSDGGPDKETILDSGATEHISPQVRGPRQPAPVSTIHGLSGKGTQVKGMGTINAVRNVMCCPGSSRRLLSVARLLEQLGGEIVFTEHNAYHMIKGKRTRIAARDGKGLYKVTDAKFRLVEEGTALVGNAISTDMARERITALHRTFGHASVESLRTILKQHNFRGVCEEHLKLLQPCNACMLGKSHKVGKSRLTADKATTFGYRLCTDCCGPFRTQSIGGAKYLMVVIDEFSSWTWGVPLQALTTVDVELARIIEVDLHQRDDTTVKILRSDGGSEFVNQRVTALLLKHGIEREVTCPNTSYQNGKAERRIRTIFERVRTGLSDSGLPPGYWAEAAVYAVYTLNRTPPPAGASPFFKRYGRHPRVAHMRPFGNPCVIYRDRTIAGKIQDAGIPGTLLGYGYVDGKNGTRVRIGNTNKVSTFRDVRCGVFPSASARVQLLMDKPVEATEGTATPEQPTAAQLTARQRNEAVDQVAVPLANHTTPDTTITTLDNEQEVEANLRVNVTTNAFTTEELGPNGNLARPFTTRNSVAHTYNVGAQVQGNWRGHGEYYNAIVTGVHKSGSRVTYDLVYDQDNEAEPGVSADKVRTRRAPARSTSTGLCGHALVTDCNPAYLAHVPDMARSHITPKHYGQVMVSKDKKFWLAAIKVELKAIKDQNVYEYVATLPDGVKALGCLWVFKVKCGPDGKVSRYKARLTVNGKTQVYGINYSETFAPVAFATTIRLLLALATMGSMSLRQFDIKSAFLYADLPKHEQVYMRTPPGFGKKGYWILRKSLYGLCQSPRLFNKHLDKTLRNLGWVSCTFDPCLYRHEQSKAFLCVVVDDMILASPSETFTKSFYQKMRAVYDIKDLGEPKYVIGVRVNIQPNSLKLLQDRYIADLHELHAPGDKATNTPAIPSITLCLKGIHGEAPSPFLSDPKAYRSLVGGLMYTLITRPDVAAAVSTCARYLSKPTQAHLNAAKRILRYLYHTREVPLIFNKCKPELLSITAFADSSWANDVDTRRSRYGYAIFVGKSLVSWRSKLHSCVALSTAEAEYCAATEAAKHIKWVASLVAFLKPETKLPTALIYEDNDACRTMVQSSQISGRNKHFELKQHFVRECYRKKIIKLLRIPTNQQVADIFTKALARPAFEAHRSKLLNGISVHRIGGSN